MIRTRKSAAEYITVPAEEKIDQARCLVSWLINGIGETLKYDLSMLPLVEEKTKSMIESLLVDQVFVNAEVLDDEKGIVQFEVVIENNKHIQNFTETFVL